MRKILLSLLLLMMVVVGFGQEPAKLIKGPRPTINLDAVPASAMEKGRISIKFKGSVESLLKAAPSKGSDGFIRFNIPSIDALNIQFKVTESKQLFSTVLNDKQFDARHKEWGFHLWYTLEFDQSVDIKRIVKEYAKLSNLIEISEPVYSITRYKAVKEFPKTTNKLFKGEKVLLTPNDPRYNEQWHYNNTGQQGGTAGKDIKLPGAWDIVTGNPNIIIGIIDGGIDVTHPDLAGNMWPTNGYNFVNNSTTIDADEHGSHVAGTVAAVNNNNIGVSGVAGGNGAANSGVKLMSLEVFGPTSTAADFGAPFIWSADRGAMIAQNSWGYTQAGVYQQSVLDGIDYFIANGGGTAMKGGIVIFAAGNSNSELLWYPAVYDPVLSVAATNNRDVRSYYSNYGTWVDISAPGGEQSFANDPKGVLSTTAQSINGGYEFLQGTSMACPHVSGVASLIVSRAPGRLSANDVRSILLTTADNHYPDNAPTMAGKLGTGRVNAFKAAQLADQIATGPLVDPATNYSLTLTCPNVVNAWTKNVAGNDVMIAYSTTGNFGIPSGAYNVGDAISGGGTVIYKGSATTFNHPIPVDSATITYKIWSVNATNNYSAGIVKTIKTPFSVRNFAGAAVGSNINLSWTRFCNTASEVIVATNNSNTFGTPSGNLVAGNAITGGGTVIYRGTAANFVHTTPINGTNYYRIWSANGTLYSSVALSATVCFGSIPGPVVEGFESTTFAPTGWQLINPNTGSITWERTTAANNGGAASARIRFYDYSNSNHNDWLLSPAVTATNADSIILSFDRAYRPYSTSATFADSLDVMISTDCGTTFTSIWKAGGVGLASTTGTTTSAFTPTAAQWANLRFDVKSVVGNAPSFLVAFRAVNKFGNNLYLDNINIYTVENGRRDARVSQIIDPAGKLCVRSLTPRVQITNLGKDTLKTVKVMYRFVSAAANVLDSVTFNGSLPIGSSATVTLKATTLAAGGAYQLTVYTKDPNGLNDQVPSNDTAKLALTVFDPQPDPVKESFEQGTFPPANWYVQSSGSAYTWERTNRGSSDKSAAAWIRNYRFNSGNKKDDLYSPLVQIGSPDSVYLSFDVSHATARFPGSTGVPLDTLEVLLTTDCGATFRSIYKKFGEDLTTVDPNFPLTFAASDTVGFVPSSPLLWRKEFIDVTRYVTANGKFQFIFRNTSNKGNNTLLDNVNISTVTLPALLKAKGYMIAPNPFEGSFAIRHVIPPTNLKGIQVMNSAGQVIVARQFNGNAASYIQVDLSKYASGAYQVKLIYDNKVVTERVIKRK